MIKNPINPDLALWIGAIERIYNSGIRRIAGIHRGFATAGKSKYRNDPMWQIALSLKSELPNVSLICDPSHIGGTRDMIYPVSQKAIDLDYDGLMIETHFDPDNAWSDAKQQVTPTRLKEILNEVRIRKSKTDNAEFNSRLEDIRSKIDRVDQEILEALSARMKYVEEIGEYKKENNVTVFQAERWIDIFRSRPELAKKLGLSKSFIENLFKMVHDESIRIQEHIMNSETAE
jgi:chorismate mutase